MNNLKSQNKLITLQILGDALVALKDATQGANDLDVCLVSAATRGLKFAVQWTKGTRVTDQNITRAIALDVIKGARTHKTHSRLTRAILAYGEALREYSSCEYNAANVYCQSTIDLTRG